MDMQAKFDEEALSIMQAASIYHRVIWMIAQERGGSLEIDTSKINPLWALKTETPDPKNLNRLKFTAESDPEPIEQQIKDIAAKLLGTSDHPQDALAAAGLPYISHTYLIARMKDYILPVGGKWVDTKAFEALPEETKKRLVVGPPTHG